MRNGDLGKVYQDGEVIVRQGEIGDCMYVIQEGQVEVVVERDDREVRLAIRGAGQPIGEMEILEHQPRSATVRALGQARVLTVDRKHFLRHIHQDPSLAYHMMQTMSQRIRELSTEVVRLEQNQRGAGAAAGRPPVKTDYLYIAPA